MRETREAEVDGREINEMEEWRKGGRGIAAERPRDYGARAAGLWRKGNAVAAGRQRDFSGRPTTFNSSVSVCGWKMVILQTLSFI